MPNSERASEVTEHLINNIERVQNNTEPSLNPTDEFVSQDQKDQEQKFIIEAESQSSGQWIFENTKNNYDAQDSKDSKVKHYDIGERVSTNRLTQGKGSMKSKKGQNKNSRVQFETYDSSLEELRDEKLVFKYIQKMAFFELEQHLASKRCSFNIFTIFDNSGFTPIHYAAHKNIEKAVEILINFVLQEDQEKEVGQNFGGSGETGDAVTMENRIKT